MAQRLSSPDVCETRMVDPDQVNAVRSTMPSDDVIGELADTFGLLSDQGRVRLLISLMGPDELCVCDLAAATSMNESSVSHALRLLRAHHVVQVRRSGRMSYYRLADSHVRMLIDLGLAHVGHTSVITPHGPSIP